MTDEEIKQYMLNKCSDRPVQYEKNNVRRRKHLSTVPKWLRQKRKLELHMYFRTKVEPWLFPFMDTVISERLDAAFEKNINNFVNYKDLDMGNANVYYVE